MSEGDIKTTNFRAIGNRVYTNKVRMVRGLGEQVESWNMKSEKSPITYNIGQKWGFN